MVYINALRGYCWAAFCTLKEWKNAMTQSVTVTSAGYTGGAKKTQQTGNCNQGHVPHAEAVMSCVWESYVEHIMLHCSSVDVSVKPIDTGPPPSMQADRISQHILFVFPCLFLAVFCHPALFDPAISLSVHTINLFDPTSALNILTKAQSWHSLLLPWCSFVFDTFKS